MSCLCQLNMTGAECICQPKIFTFPETNHEKQVTASGKGAQREVETISNTVSAPNVVAPDMGNQEVGLVPITSKENIVDKYCLITYDKKPYPGQILEVDETDIKVSCMIKVGKNAFYWPRLVPDIGWYPENKVLGLIPEPQQIPGENKHFAIDSIIYAKVF